MLGVNVVGHEPDKLKEIMQKEEVTWRSISSQEITSHWNAGTPTYYVIDAQGVIRKKWVGNPGEKAIESALEKWVHKAEEDAKK